ncbi:hypothetical protein CIB95_06850 [Lottiidibacillus patelloidae]|uniref:Uncharacterized protein n=1 Tax=Lottiidibacillus patelloidae TaxID=2670334 RepID=A0A263BTY4_9BACI|nr:hypothetical protein CIB95_06850 [Lottiidibacillus patelloidae]
MYVVQHCCFCPICNSLHNNSRLSILWQNERQQNQYPEINPATFQKSADNLLLLLPQATLLIEKIKKSTPFAKKIQGNAQVGKTEEVKKLLKEAGITSKVKISYNPDQISIHIYNHSESITVTLPW